MTPGRTVCKEDHWSEKKTCLSMSFFICVARSHTSKPKFRKSFAGNTCPATRNFFSFRRNAKLSKSLIENRTGSHPSIPLSKLRFFFFRRVISQAPPVTTPVAIQDEKSGAGKHTRALMECVIWERAHLRRIFAWQKKREVRCKKKKNSFYRAKFIFI